jgi:pimeloyl-ACP methyl ester carboxylesterase
LGQVAALLRAHGPVDGRALFRTSRSYQEVAAVSPSTAASLLAQFDKPLALERVRRLEDLPGAVPYDNPDDLRLVRAPTLVIGAPGDPSHPVRMAEELARLLPGSGMALITPRDVSPERNLADLKAAVRGFLGQPGPLNRARLPRCPRRGPPAPGRRL